MPKTRVRNWGRHGLPVKMVIDRLRERAELLDSMADRLDAGAKALEEYRNSGKALPDELVAIVEHETAMHLENSPEDRYEWMRIQREHREADVDEDLVGSTV